MKMNNKVSKLLRAIIAICIVCCPSLLLAQDLPCGGNDPYATCPLDSWVIVLAAIALIFAVVHLGRKQKAAPAVKM